MQRMRNHRCIILRNREHRKESESEVTQSCPTLCDPMDSSLHQAPPSMGFSRREVLEWVAISFSRESSQPRDQTQVSHIVDRRFTVFGHKWRKDKEEFRSK